MNHEVRDLFARDGHLTMLSLDRYDMDELDVGARHGVESHVEECARCRARLQAVAVHEPVLLPRVAAGRSTGSATIATLTASAGFALAASAVLGLGTAMWPSPQAARESTTEPAHTASSYTSVAQEYSDSSDLEVELSMRGDTLVATSQGEGFLAVLAVLDDASTGTPVVTSVLAADRRPGDAITLALPRREAGRIVAVFCVQPLTFAVGDALAIDSDCVVSEPAD
jgi:hypothetical protein